MNYRTDIKDLVLRDAEPADYKAVYDLIMGIAEYEKMTDLVSATPEDIKESIFERNEAAVILAEYNGEIAGFALYFRNYSTFLGRANMYLEDLFVYPRFRKKGIGKALFTAVAKAAYLKGDGRMDWVCLDWNKPSIDFYESMGAKDMKEWKVFRLDRNALENIAEKEEKK